MTENDPEYWWDWKAGAKMARSVIEEEAKPLSPNSRMKSTEAYLRGYDETMNEEGRDPDPIVDRDPGDEA